MKLSDRQRAFKPFSRVIKTAAGKNANSSKPFFYLGPTGDSIPSLNAQVHDFICVLNNGICARENQTELGKAIAGGDFHFVLVT